MIQVKRAMLGKRTRLVGPNCPGVSRRERDRIRPEVCRIGIAPVTSTSGETLGVVSVVDSHVRGGVATHLPRRRQSTCLGIGGDPVFGTSHVEALEMFEADPDTKGIILIGEIGGSAEEAAALGSKSTALNGGGFHRRSHRAPAAHGARGRDRQRRQRHGCGQDCRVQSSRHWGRPNTF